MDANDFDGIIPATRTGRKPDLAQAVRTQLMREEASILELQHKVNALMTHNIALEAENELLKASLESAYG